MTGGSPRSPTLRAMLAASKLGRCYICGAEVPQTHRRGPYRRKCSTAVCQRAYEKLRSRDIRAEARRLEVAR